VSEPPLRVLYVANSADIYGASRCLLRLCAALDHKRFMPVVAVPEDGPLVAFLRKAGVEEIVQIPLSVTTRDVFKSWRLVPFLLNIPFKSWRLRSAIRKLHIDLVHTNVGTIPSAPLGAWLAGVPHILNIRDWYGEFPGLWKWYRRYILAFSDKVICVSYAMADQFPKIPKVTVVHDVIPLAEFEVDRTRLRREFRKKYNIPPDRCVVGCIGRIKFVRKGQEFLVRAIAILRQQHRLECTTIIVGAPAPGSEEDLPRLKALAEELGVSDRIIFTGELSDPRSAYAALDVFVLPSAQPEPFGGVVMEAMGMGKPVVATALGGALDQVVDGQTGYLVPPANPSALAEKLLKLIEDPLLQARMGAAGAERLRTDFSLQGMMKEIEAIYREVLAL
jgi:glycosyltransferase involved in cell wall biosynthesis